MAYDGGAFGSGTDNATVPLPASGAGSAGTSRKASPADHSHAPGAFFALPILTLGDSITANGGGPGAVTASIQARSWLAWALCQIGWPAQYVCNAGVGGDTTAMMLARLPALLTTYTRPGLLIILGGVNDVAADTPAATTQANLAQMIALGRAKGWSIILGYMTPTSSIVGTPARVQSMLDTIRWCRAQAIAHSEYIRVWDAHGSVADPSTGALYSSYAQSDNVHPACWGALAMGTTLKPLLRDLLPPFPDFYGTPLDPYSLCPNPTNRGSNAAGAGGSFCGTNFTSAAMPDCMQASRLSTTSSAVISLQARADGHLGNFARVALTTTTDKDGFQAYYVALNNVAWAAGTAYAKGAHVNPGNGYHYRVTTAGTSHAATQPTWPTQLGATVVDNTVTWTCVKAWAAGDTIYCKGEIQMTLPAGKGAVPRLRLACKNAANATLATTDCLANVDGSGVTDVIPTTLMPTGLLVMETPPLVIPADTVRLEMGYYVNTSGGLSGDGLFDIGRIETHHSV